MFKFIINDSTYNEVTTNLFNKLTAIINGTEIKMEAQTLNAQTETVVGQQVVATLGGTPQVDNSVGWDDVYEGGGKVFPASMYATTLVGVVWGNGVDDYDKTKEPRPFKGIKCIFATNIGGVTEYITTGKYYVEMKLTEKGFLTKLLQAITGDINFDINTIKTVNMTDYFRSKLGSQIMIQLDVSADGKYNKIAGMSKTTTMNPTTQQLEQVPSNINVPNLDIPAIYSKDAINSVLLPKAGEIAPQPVQVQPQQAVAPVQATPVPVQQQNAAPQPVQPQAVVQQAAPIQPIQPVQPQ